MTPGELELELPQVIAQAQAKWEASNWGGAGNPPKRAPTRPRKQSTKSPVSPQRQGTVKRQGMVKVEAGELELPQAIVQAQAK